MRYPWEFGSPPPDDQEGLQTDVMRFIAILGLCLAAIFSLVTAAEKERSERPPAENTGLDVAQVAASPVAKPAGMKKSPRPAPPVLQDQPAPGLPQRDDPVQATPPREEPRQPAPPSQESQGFSLVFESTDALHQLLSNDAVALFASAGNVFWKLGAGGRFESAPAPVSYYAMHTDTLPDQIRRASAGLGDLSRISWGVTLPDATARRIEQMMASRAGGDLVIGSDASVSWGEK